MKGGERVRITIDGAPNEIAALVLEVQGRRRVSQEEFERMLEEAMKSIGSTVEHKWIRGST